MQANASKIALIGGLFAIGGVTIVHSAQPAPPADWFVSGPEYQDYSARVDHTVAYDGSGSGLLESKTEALSPAGTLMQTVAGSFFAGKRVRYSAYIRTQAVQKLAGLWIRAEDVTGRVVAFKNLISPGSSLRGTADWTRVYIVIDIPTTATAVFYGVQLLGPGAVWIDDARFDVLGMADPSAAGPTFDVYNGPTPKSHLLPYPENLDFEK